MEGVQTPSEFRNCRDKRSPADNNIVTLQFPNRLWFVCVECCLINSFGHSELEC